MHVRQKIWPRKGSIVAKRLVFWIVEHQLGFLVLCGQILFYNRGVITFSKSALQESKEYV